MQSEGVYDYIPQERIVFGRPAAGAICDEAARLGKSRLFLVASKSLNRKTGAIAEIADALGGRFVGLFDDGEEHTPRQSVIACAQAVRDAAPDLIVTVGGGSAIDMVKVVQICLAQDVRTVEALDDWHVQIHEDGSYHAPKTKPSPVRQIAVPTTLSGAEFSTIGGSTDRGSGIKHGYVGCQSAPQTVILDPAITVHTPEWLWLSTGIRGLDHAVEGLASPKTNPFVQGLCLQAIRLFADGLRRTKRHPEDLGARLACQQAVWMAGHGIDRVPYGASHGIGGALGGLKGVAHGYTSCILMPHVLRYNKPACAEEQRAMAEAFGAPGEEVADLVAALISDLGMPRRLRDVGVSRDDFLALGERSLKNMWVKTNPQPIRTQADVVSILEAAF